MERNVDTKDEKIQKLKEEKEYLEITRSEQGNTIDETATLIRELRDKLLESQSDVNKLKRRLEGNFDFYNTLNLLIHKALSKKNSINLFLYLERKRRENQGNFLYAH